MSHVAKAEFNEAVREARIAKVELFQRLDKYVPHVGGLLRDMSLVSLLRIPLEDYTFPSATLFNASASMDGPWHITDTRLGEYDATVCKRQIACLVDISIHLEGVA